ncbi:type I toxin-antitoxin system toxin [Enterococcus casseliflavus]
MSVTPIFYEKIGLLFIYKTKSPLFLIMFTIALISLIVKLLKNV